MEFLYGLLSALSFGISNIYWKKAARDADYVFLVLFRGLIAIALFGISWLCIVFYGLEFEAIININARKIDYLNAYMLCCCCALGLFFFLKSMEYAPVSITVALSSANIFGILTAIFIVGEKFTVAYLLVFLIAIMGILLSQHVNLQGSLFQWNKGATFALLASLFWGITYPLFKFVSPAVGALPLSFILESSVTLMALFWAIASKMTHHTKPLFTKVQVWHYIFLALLLIGGTLFYNLAIQNLSVLHLNLINNFQYLVSIFFAIVIYREKLTNYQILGMLLIFLSIVLVQYFV